MANLPTLYNFPTHYRGDGLPAIILHLFYKTGVSVDLTGCSALMQLRKPDFKKNGEVMWIFSTDATEPEKLIEIEAQGKIKFPEIPSWELQQNTYEYDLQITDTFGFVKTFLKGVFKINQDITK